MLTYTPLRQLRMNLYTPLSLREVAEHVEAQGYHCTVGHLSMVEVGTKRPGPKLCAILARLYKVERSVFMQAVERTLALRARKPKAGRMRRAS